MIGHLSVCGPDNRSEGFPLQDVTVTLSETGFLTITGECPLSQQWAITIPVEYLSAVKAAESKNHG